MFFCHSQLQLAVLFQTKKFDQCCTLLKELMAHELKYKFNDDDQHFLFMIAVVLGLPPTAATLRELTRDQMMMMVMAPLMFGFGPNSPIGD